MTELARAAGERFLPIVETDIPSYHPVGRFARYWSRLAARHGAPPPREAFDPMQVPSALPWAVLLQRSRRSDGALDYWVRVHGSDAVEFAGGDWTGDWLGRRIPTAAHVRRLAEFEQAFSEKRPLFARVEAALLCPYHRWLRGTYPFRAEAGGGQILLLCVPDLPA